jgi:hypothetical protein
LTVSSTIDPPPAPAGSSLEVLLNVKRELEAAGRRVNEEIGTYPAPIPACDAQFNYLLEQRRKIAGELNRVETLLAQRQTEAVEARVLADLVARASIIDEKLAARLTDAMAEKNRPPATRKPE